MSKKQLFITAIVAAILVAVRTSRINSDQFIDLLILGRIPGTTTFVAFEFMFVIYIIIGMIVARLFTDFKNDYWRFHFFKLKARQHKRRQKAAKKQELVAAAVSEAQTT